ncbi:MAG: CPBP family glutamic-type intramembrane protease [Planctomycetota bacterium]|nr:CPBP family glutamic-type intramembrane protease [Planctomycetota bacterium]
MTPSPSEPNPDFQDARGNARPAFPPPGEIPAGEPLPVIGVTPAAPQLPPLGGGGEPRSASVARPSLARGVDPGQAPGGRPPISSPPRVERVPDPGSPFARRIALVLVVVLISLVAAMQQVSVSTPPPPSATPELNDPYSFMMRVLVKVGSSEFSSPTTRPLFATNVRETPLPLEQRVRASVALGELSGTEAAIESLNQLEFNLKPAAPALGESPSSDTAPTAESAQDATKEPGADAAMVDGSGLRDDSGQRNDPGLARETQDPGVASAGPSPATKRANVLRDIRALRTVYTEGGSALDAADRQRLIDRHGWFAELALASGPDVSPPGAAPTPERRKLLEGGGALAMVMVLAVMGGGTLLIAGIVAATLFVIARAQGKIRLRFVPPAPGGSVYLETVAVFVASFLLLQVVLGLIITGASPAGGSPQGGTADAAGAASVVGSVVGQADGGVVGGSVPTDAGSGGAGLSVQAQPEASEETGAKPASNGVLEQRLPLIAQWVTLLAIFWPLCRGVSFSRWRHDVGFTGNFFKEVVAGAGVYVAGLPFVALAALVSLALKGLWESATGAPGPAGELGEGDVPLPNNPILDTLAKSDGVSTVLLFLLATVWAPVVEEIIFRGCLFRHLRSRLIWIGAAIISAFAFGVMHGYEFLMLGPVITLGFIFSAMREWRGSLYGAIVMHCLHNASVLSVLILVVQLSS